MARSGKYTHFTKENSSHRRTNFSNKYLVCLWGSVKFPMWMQVCRQVHYSGYVCGHINGLVKGMNGSAETVLLDSPAVASFLPLLKLLAQTHDLQILPNNL